MRKTLVLLSIALFATGLSLWMVEHLPFVQMGERWIADYRVATLSPPAPQDPEIVIVTINEDTLRRFPYRSPVDREFLAALLKELALRGAKAVAMDLLFDQPTEPEKDLLLKTILAEIQLPLVVAFADQQDGESEEQQDFLERFVPKQRRALANLAKDPNDGTVRWAYAGRPIHGEWLSGLSFALAKGLGVMPPDQDLEIVWHGAPSAEVPAFRKLPAETIALLPDEWLKGKIVLVGADLTLTDRHRTPFSTARKGLLTTMAGIEIHAHILAQLLNGRTSTTPSLAVNAVLVAMVSCLGILLAGLEWSLPPKLIAAGVTSISFWVFGFSLFHEKGVMVPLIAPSLAFVVAVWLTELYGNRQQRKQRRFIQDAFNRYVAPSVVDQLLRDPSKLSLGGERKQITLIFSDVTGFTKLSESIDAKALGNLLNEYLGGLCDIILAHRGTIVEFMGDAVFAIFGAPVGAVDHARQGVDCALAMDAFSEQFRKKFEPLRWGWGATRIGVHTGMVLIGNFGSEQRFKYVPVGDSVNIASRIEGLNKHFGTRICVSAASLSGSHKAQARPLGRVVLKGRSDPTEIYELLDEGFAASAFIEGYRQAYDLLDQGQVARARQCFEALAREHPDDLCCRLHLSRILAGKEDTVIVMDEK